MSDNEGLGNEYPPDYQATQDNEDVDGARPPPSYSSLFGELKAAKEEAGGPSVSYYRRICSILMGSLAATIILISLSAFPIAMIVIGALKLDDCPAKQLIPKWLLIMGCFGLLKNLISLGIQMFRRKRDNSQDQQNMKRNLIEGFLDVFLIVWFVLGCVWVFGIYRDVSYTEGSEHYCDRLVYLFSFWSLLSTVILIGLGLCCCFCICAKLTPYKDGWHPA